jgi:hypothetical protein
MSFDSSRFTFDPYNNFSGVLMQQGRVQLDSDWNEWLAEFLRRIRAGTLDTLGRAVVPMTTPNAFQITFTQDSSGNASISIGIGRMYVDGLLAENHGLPAPNPVKWIPAAGAALAPPDIVRRFLPSQVWDLALDELAGQTGVAYDQQPYYPNANSVAPFPQSGGPYFIYLDVWQREVTFLEDPDLIEKAVGVDTTGRLQTIWQVKWLDVSAVKDVNCSTKDANLPAVWQNLVLPPGPRLTTGVVQSSPSGPCCLTPNTGFTGLENQLYRVEIHQPGAVGDTTFKWSRDNASVATRVLAIMQGGSVLTVESTGKDDVLRFSPNDWVEVTDDWLELNGLPGELHLVSQVNDAAKTITVSSAVSPASFPVDSHGLTDLSRHTRLTRWDQSGKVFQSDGVTVWADLGAAGSTGDIKVPPGGTTLILENGVTVSFGLAPNATLFRTGDNWEFAARSSDGVVEFLNFAPPRGIYHHYARLAVMSVSSVQLAATGTLTLRDESQPPVAFLTFQANNPASWPANFGVAARANPVNASNFDLEVVYNPSAAQGVTPPVTVESFSNLSLDPNAADYAPKVLRSSNFISVLASFSPPSTAPVFPKNFSSSPTPLPASGTIQLQDASNPPISFLTLQTTSVANWTPNFAVSASPFGTAGNFTLEVVYAGSGADSSVTLERFQNLSLSTVASQVNSQFITNLATPLKSPFPPLNLISLTDCRTFWPPSSTQAQPALHVTAINWANDAVMPIGTFMQGLQITLDGPPVTASVSASTMIVTVEVPQPALSTNASPVGLLASDIVEIQGSPTVSGNVIGWAPPVGATLPINVPAGSRLRARVRLLGHFIWGMQNNALLYLDGQAFGTPATVAGAAPSTTLILPSGNAARASDFQSWFWLAPSAPLGFTVTTAAPPTLRGEGLTEIVSDIILTGTGGTPTPAGSAVPLVNITVTLNTAVTGRLLSLTAPFLQDAVLLIDDPAVLNASAAGGLNGVGGNGLDFKNGQAPNLILGQFNPSPSTPNTVTFLNVPIDAPGAGVRILRITNLRANAVTATSTGAANQVLAIISAAGSIQLPLTNPTVPVGFVQAAASAAVVSTLPSGAFTIDPQAGVNTALAANPAATGAIDVLLQFTGAFPGAFRPKTAQRTIAIGAAYTAEETFDGAGLPLAHNSPALNAFMGRADQGVEFVARFQNVPSGVQIFVTTRDVPPGGLAGGNPDAPPALAILKVPAGTGGSTPGGVPLGSGGKTSGVTAGIPIAPIPVTSGAGQAIWEWVGAPQPSQVQTLEFGVVLAMPSGGAAPPAAVTATVNLSLGPLSSVATASENDPVPRFADVSHALTLFTLL